MGPGRVELPVVGGSRDGDWFVTQEDRFTVSVMKDDDLYGEATFYFRHRFAYEGTVVEAWVANGLSMTIAEKRLERWLKWARGEKR